MRKDGLRLRRSSDFRQVFREGRRFSSPHFVLYIRQSGLPAARMGVSISKSHVKLATRRNRLRRVAKEWFRQKLSVRFKGYDFILASRASYRSKNTTEAVREIKELISSIEVK